MRGAMSAVSSPRGCGKEGDPGDKDAAASRRGLFPRAYQEATEARERERHSRKAADPRGPA